MFKFLSGYVFSVVILIGLITSLLFLIFFLGHSIKSGKKESGVLETLSPFECGFNSFFKKYSGFCVQFLNIAILFLLVDLEIALIIPIFFNSFFLEKVSKISVKFSFFIGGFLVLLLVIEYIFGGLSWKEEV